LLTALHVAEEVCPPVAHRQVVLTIPKRLRVLTRFDRQLLGKLSSCAWTFLKAEARRLLSPPTIAPRRCPRGARHDRGDWRRKASSYTGILTSMC